VSTGSMGSMGSMAVIVMAVIHFEHMTNYVALEGNSHGAVTQKNKCGECTLSNGMISLCVWTILRILAIKSSSDYFCQYLLPIQSHNEFQKFN